MQVGSASRSRNRMESRMSKPFQNPEDSRVPVAPLRVLQEKRLNTLLIPSCAVPEQGRVGGCQFAKECAARCFGQPRNLGFGPATDIPGTGGDGPQNLGVYIRDGASRTERMTEMACHTFMATLFDRWEQQNRTGDTVTIVCGEGGEIVTRHLMPVDANSNKTGDVRMREVVEKVKVSTYPTLATQSPEMEYAQAMAAIRERAERDRLLGERLREDDGAGEDMAAEVGAAPVKEKRGTSTGRG